MNEPDQKNPPPPIAPAPAPEIPFDSPKPKPARPLSWWLRKFFACNPFYLVSAALLLYGCYRVSIDTPFLNQESARLVFNFTSVQIYEAVLVLVAIFLARRCLWYDSTLLAGLENLLVLVPFILISQAALTGNFMTAVMCLIGVGAAVVRFGGLRQFFKQLNLPDRLLEAGFVLLVLNLGLPLLYRYLEETKYGTHLDYGPAFDTNERVWLLMLPIVLALANFLPPPAKKGNRLPQHPWLPMGLFSLWVIGTGVHLYSLDYVYEYYIRPDLFAPSALVLAWTFFVRCPGEFPRLKYALMVPPLLTPLLATAPGANATFLVLSGGNLFAYATVLAANRKNRFAPHLVYASALLLISRLPTSWLHGLSPTLSLVQSQWVAAGIAIYFVLWTAWLRNPKLAIFGAIALGCVTDAITGHRAVSIHWAWQAGLVFFLLHSLRWHDDKHAGAASVRALVACVWAFESFLWVNSHAGHFWMPLIPGGIVLAVYCLMLPGRGIWRLAVVPTAALVVIFSGPFSGVINFICSAPAGLVAVIASFALLGLGTIAALTRELWHRHEHDLKPVSSQSTGPGPE